MCMAHGSRSKAYFVPLRESHSWSKEKAVLLHILQRTNVVLVDGTFLKNKTRIRNFLTAKGYTPCFHGVITKKRKKKRKEREKSLQI